MQRGIYKNKYIEQDIHHRDYIKVQIKKKNQIDKKVKKMRNMREMKRMKKMRKMVKMGERSKMREIREM